MPINLIWAQARGGVIGVDGTIPWHVPEDFARFKQLTLGSPVVMGRKTWDSLPRKPLPGRENLVLTRDPGWAADGASAIAEFPLVPDYWVLGGGEIYRAAMGFADGIEVTEIDIDVDGDTVAPPIGAEFVESACTPWETSRTGPRYRFRSYRRALVEPLPAPHEGSGHEGSGQEGSGREGSGRAGSTEERAGDHGGAS